MTNYIFWGASGHARVLRDLVGLQGGEVLALFDNNPETVAPWVGAEVITGWRGFENWYRKNANLFSSPLLFAVAIGGARGLDRVDIGLKLLHHGLVSPPLVHPSSIVAASALIGAGAHVLAGSILGSKASIGEFSILNTKASIDHDCNIGRGVHIAPGATLCGEIVVEDFAHIGPGATILPRLQIGEGALVAAGSVVTKDVPPHVMVLGVPAKVIKELK